MLRSVVVTVLTLLVLYLQYNRRGPPERGCYCQFIYLDDRCLDLKAFLDGYYRWGKAGPTSSRLELS